MLSIYLLFPLEQITQLVIYISVLHILVLLLARPRIRLAEEWFDWSYDIIFRKLEAAFSHVIMNYRFYISNSVLDTICMNVSWVSIIFHQNC